MNKEIRKFAEQQQSTVIDNNNRECQVSATLETSSSHLHVRHEALYSYSQLNTTTLYISSTNCEIDVFPNSATFLASPTTTNKHSTNESNPRGQSSA